jgi:Ricin-type beta-trefoil lectin domain/Putative Ig domain
MRVRNVIIAASAALALVAGGTAAGSALAGASASPVPGASGQAGPPAPHVVNLHQAFNRALPHVRHGRIAGIVVPVGKRHKPAVRTAAACTEPNCNLVYQGGSVQHSPHVYILLWGPNWPNTDPQLGVESNLFHGLGVTSHDAWSTITSQYRDGTGNPAFGATVFAGAFQDTSPPPNPVSLADLAAEADAFATKESITDLADAQIVISAQSGTCYSSEGGGFAGNCGAPNPSGLYCAYHSSSNEPFTNLPYQTDAGAFCGENFINPGSAGRYDGVSMDAGHEYAETITDPFPDTGWVDLNDNVSGGEIGDKCDFSSASRDVTLGTGRFAMQPLWSNAAGRCVLTTDRVTVTSPGNQSGVIAAGVSLQVHASSSARLSLSYRATGLPSGLSISAAGLISGKPSVTAGTFGVRVTATDSAGTAAGSVSFTWFVRSGTGAVKGLASKCADDFRGRTVNGNKIDISTCTGRNPQKFTFLANGELTLEGKCIRDVSGRVVLFTCGTVNTEEWTRHANGEYVVRFNGTCLNAPSSTNGTQLTLARCTGSTRQQWSLP